MKTQTENEKVEQRFKNRLVNNQIEAIVLSVNRGHMGPLTIVCCSVADKLTGETIDNLPCAGLDLRPGDQILVTVSRLTA